MEARKAQWKLYHVIATTPRWFKEDMGGPSFEVQEKIMKLLGAVSREAGFSLLTYRVTRPGSRYRLKFVITAERSGVNLEKIGAQLCADIDALEDA